MSEGKSDVVLESIFDAELLTVDLNLLEENLKNQEFIYLYLQ